MRYITCFVIVGIFFCYYRIFNVSAKEGTTYKTKSKINVFNSLFI